MVLKLYNINNNVSEVKRTCSPSLEKQEYIRKLVIITVYFFVSLSLACFIDKDGQDV